MELTGVPAEWLALRDLGEHHLREAASTRGKQDGRGEHLRLVQRGLGGRPHDWEEGIVAGNGARHAGWGRRASRGARRRG